MYYCDKVKNKIKQCIIELYNAECINLPLEQIYNSKNYQIYLEWIEYLKNLDINMQAHGTPRLTVKIVQKYFK